MAEFPTLPIGPLDLLVKAALAPPPVAGKAWAEWRKGYALDETPWTEVRLLGAVAQRISWLEPDADILPRIRGIQKFLYAQSQLCLVGAMGGLRDLSGAGIPMLFLKGAGRVAVDDGIARERLVRDIDVLVPIDRRDEACERLGVGGWQLRGAWQTLWRSYNSLAGHHGWSLSRGRGEIDLHHFSNNLNRLVGDDDGLWARSSRVTWRGIEVHVPSATDNLLIAVVHGLRWSRDLNADWIIDGFRAISSGAIDWALLLEEARRRHVATILHAGLSYLRAALEAPVPSEILDALTAMGTRRQMNELHFYTRVSLPFNLEQNAAFLAMAVERSGEAGDPEVRHPARLTIGPGELSLGVRYSVDISGLLKLGGTRLNVRLVAPAAPGARLIGMIFILGMIFDCREVEVADEGDEGAACTLSFIVHPKMLVGRGISRIVLRVIAAGSAPIIPWGNVHSEQ